MLRRYLSIALAFVLVGSAELVAPCPTAVAAPQKRVTRVLVRKQQHVMQLLAADAKGQEEIVASYKVAIGPGGLGPKRQEGDMTTPVGRYHVIMHQPSQYKVFLRLDYPTPADYRRFTESKEKGALPKGARIGGDIGIHGPPVSMSTLVKSSLKEVDWTAGCIAVDEDEITEISRLVRDGTVVDIEE
jgi:murein L,D-transpeptidase YafK